MPDREKVINELVEHIESALAVDSDYVDCVRTDLLQTVVGLLKEQEAVEPKTGHWIFESAYREAWSHTCSECGKRMTTAYNTYANYCWNCGAKMEGR